MSKNGKNTRKSKKMRKCPMCGYEFDLEKTDECRECFFGKRCRLVMCPRCHYEFPRF